MFSSEANALNGEGKEEDVEDSDSDDGDDGSCCTLRRRSNSGDSSFS